MPLQPSRRDTSSPPPFTDDLAPTVRHQGSYLRGIDGGFLDGRLATPQPNPAGPSEIVGGNGEGGEGDPISYEWEWDDRLVVTSAGQQSFRLSHLPVEESLVIRWHPDGKGPLTQINERYSVNDQVVTIYDSDDDIEPGDLFSAQYQFDPGEEIVEGALILVGVGTTAGTDPSIPLPGGSAVGDFMVLLTVAGSGPATTSDSRLVDLMPYTMVLGQDSHIYAGTLTSLGNVETNGSLLATWAVFRAPVPSGLSASVVGPGIGPTVAVPQLAISRTIFAGQIFKGVTTASFSVPDGYTDAILGDQDHFAQRVCYWDDGDADISPAGSFLGNFDDYVALVLGVTNFIDDEE